MKFEGIACIEKNGGLSFQSELPWLKDNIGDLEYVRVMTSLVPKNMINVIIVGRKTFETLPQTFINNPYRTICILSKKKLFTINENVLSFESIKMLNEYLLELEKKQNLNKVFIFGGSEIYTLFLEKSYISTFYLTKINKDYECDIHFPLDILTRNYVLNSSTEMDSKNRIFEIWERKYHPEHDYLQLLRDVYINGEKRETRNGLTYSLFGKTLEFDIKKYGFPLLTTKKMFFKGIAKELLWFLKGDTDVNNLIKDGVHIWDGNTSRSYLDSIGLHHYPERCAGPIYGYQWRNFNAPYDFKNMKPLENGIDQLVNCIREIRDNPYSRRLLISGWNPEQMKEMCLPPCHVLYQFYVIDDTLCCQMYQRSADLFLGLPFNIASTSLLTYIIASIVGYNVGKVKICIGDAHIYGEHVNNVLEQIERTPFDFCKITIRNKYKHLSIEEQLEKMSYDDIILENYMSHGVLKSIMKT